MHREPLVAIDHPIGLGVRRLEASPALMGKNRFSQIVRSAIVEKEETLPESPQRSGPEFITPSCTLAHTIREPWSHVMKQQI